MNTYRIKGITKDMTRSEKLQKLDEIMRQAFIDGNRRKYERASAAYEDYDTFGDFEW